MRVNIIFYYPERMLRIFSKLKKKKSTVTEETLRTTETPLSLCDISPKRGEKTHSFIDFLPP
jgi:hypothetical protein